MNNEEKDILPELRFPDFDQTWTLGTVEDLADTTMGNAFKSSDFVDNGLQLLRMGNLYQNQLQLDRNPVYLPFSFKEEYNRYLLNSGDILMSMTGTVGKEDYGFVIQIPDNSPDLLLNQRVLKIEPKRNCAKEFLFQLLRSEGFLQTLYSLPGGTKQANLSVGQLKGISIAFPEMKEEQQKVANCLSSLDDLIGAETEKLDSLKDHKKGLLQQLFPAEGETVPELRFPAFENDGEWEKKELSQLGELINGLTYSPKDVKDDGLLVLRSSNVQNGVIDLQDRVFVRPDIKGANLSEPNDILVCVRNGSKQLIGKNALIPKAIPLATHGAFMTVFRADHPEFVFQLFQTESYDKQVKADLGATINSINGKNFIRYEFKVPTNPDEKQKIADFLISLDVSITVQSKKIEALKDHKKGLMQQLFPNLNEQAQ